MARFSWYSARNIFTLVRLHPILLSITLLALALLPHYGTAQTGDPYTRQLLRVQVVVPVVSFRVQPFASQPFASQPFASQPFAWQPQQPDTCYTIKRVYVQNHWEVDENGNRRYVPGHWTRRRVAIRCPEQAAAPERRCSQPTLDEERFSRLYSAINARSFEMNKMTLAMELVQTQCLTSAQVRAVVRLFKYEESRLRIATAAYNNTVDKNSYALVRESLRFKISRDKLDAYISRQRNAPARGQAPVRRGY